MQRYIAIVFSVLCLMLLSNSVQAQDIAYNFTMPVGYPDGSGWGLNGGWGYMEDENPGPGFEFHPGEDLNINTGGNTDCGKEIRASASGIVTESADFGQGWGNIIEIKSTLPDGSNVWLIYAHERTRYVVVGDNVHQGDLIGLVGGGTLYQDNPGDVNDVYEYACHMHLEVRLQNLSAGYWPEGQSFGSLDEVIYTNPRDFIASHQGIPPNAQTAIERKADELWGMHLPGETRSCGTHYPLGLICEEPPGGDMHWYGGDTATHKSFIIEDWNMGAWDWVALTFDPSNTAQQDAYILRHAFWDAYRNRGGPDVYGAPLGDEMDLGLSYYTPHDSYCGTDKTGCVRSYCGPTSDFTSVQRFEHASFCWHPATQEVCLSSPNDEGGEHLPYCYEISSKAKYWPDRILFSFNPCIPEVRDNLDNDCDGLVDEAFDLDLDGYSYDTGDCDERYNGVHVGATEYYDGLDNDCNGLIDDVTWYEDQYLFFDADGNGDDDPCVRRFTHDLVCLCDGAYLYWYVPGPILATGEYVLWRNDRNTYYDYAGADGIADLVVNFGDGIAASEYLYWHTTIAVRYGNQLQLDRNLDGILNTYFYYGAGDSEDAYYLADLNGDGWPDPIVRRGNLYIADTDDNQVADWYFTYGTALDDTYFADLDGDGMDGIIVRRGALLLVNETLQHGPASNPRSNTATYTFSYGVGR